MSEATLIGLAVVLVIAGVVLGARRRVVPAIALGLLGALVATAMVLDHYHVVSI